MQTRETTPDPIRRTLLVLARHLPELRAELSDDGDRLAVSDGSASVEVELTTPCTTSVAIPVYRDTSGGEVYGYAAHPSATADRIRTELKELGEHA